MQDETSFRWSIKSTALWFCSIIGLTILFYVTARLGLLLAIPPGYATSIWLPSGIALAFILLFGYRMAPAIWLGSFLVNFHMSGHMLIAGSIGLGSTLQAILGAYLVKRYIGFPNPLDNDKEIFSFLILGGPISCLVAATWGCITLWLTHQIPMERFLYNWFTWWSGDTIGVLVFTPFILIWSAEPREVWRQRRLSLAVPLCIMFGILIAFFLYTNRWKHEKLVNDFETHAQYMSALFEIEASAVTGPKLQNILTKVSREVSANNMVLNIYDIQEGKERLLYSTAVNNDSSYTLSWQKVVKIADRQIVLKYMASENYLTNYQTWEVWVIPLSGVLLTGLLGALLLSVTGKAALIEGVVARRTLELSSVNQNLLNEIKQRKQVEEALNLHASELARSNSELQQFAYVASHDFKEPLRMIVTFLQLLEKEYADQLDVTAKEYIQYAVDGGKRMQDLINDLLTFSQVNSANAKLELISGETILQQALDNLKIAIVESKAEITHDELPELLADKTQLVQLFQNLISNAIKFSDKEKVEIHVGVMPYKNTWLFSVRDNGIGISTEFYDRIFALFQRLHTRETFQGTGIGLAVCKKIVEQHGGEIWVESTEGQGTTFYFTFPIAKTKKKTG